MASKNAYTTAPASKPQPHQTYYIASVGLHVWEIILWLIVLLFIIGITTASVYSTQRKANRSVKTTLETLTTSTSKALDLWSREQRFIVQELARDKRVLHATQVLLATTPTKQSLIRSPAQSRLRLLFRNFLKGGTLRGFFIINHTDLNLASSRDTNVGIKTLLNTQPEFLKRIQQGKTLFSHIQRSDVPLPEQRPISPGTQHLTMFVGTPIRDEKNQVIALLLLRLDPNQTLYPLLLQARLGHTGRAYLLDPNGSLLSPKHTQHEEQNPQPPGKMKVFKLHTSVRRLPFTPTTPSKFTQRSEGNVGGYVDAHGERTVGAWKWLPNFRVWLLVEQGWTESFALFLDIERNSYLSSGLLSLLLLVLLLAFGFGRKKYREGQIRLAAVVENAQDPIILLDASGTIKSINPSTETMFGYEPSDLLEKNIVLLLPCEHQTFPKQLDQDSRLGTSRELRARQKNGTTFLVESTVGQAKLDTGLHFSLILRDITTNKELEQSLEEERYFNQTVLDSLSPHIAVLDETGRIVFVNEVWKTFAAESGLEDEGCGLGQSYTAIIKTSHGLSSEKADEIAKRLKELFDKQRENFSLEYKSSTGKERWFELLAVHFTLSNKSMLVLSHAEITERKRAERDLKRMSIIAEKTDNGVVIADSNKRVQWVNPGFTAISGYTLEELLGKNPGQVLQGPETDKEAIKRVADAIKKQEHIEETLLNYHKDGSPYWIQIELMPIVEDGEVTGFIALERDVTEQRRASEQLQQAKEDAETANQLKSAFLATMSHEIRTPLNGIVATVDMLGHTRLESAQYQLVSTARHSSLALMSIIDDVLDFSKIESGEMSLSKEEIVIEKLVENCVGSLELYAEEKDIELLMFVAPELPDVSGDRIRLKQILYNLTGNAIKFSSGLRGRKGKVMVSAFPTNRTGGNTTLTLEVRDNGIGIEPSIQEKLFKPFLQADSTTTRRFGGSGLGLAITRRLTDLMDGTITLESQPGFGSTFRVELPLTFLPEKKSPQEVDFQQLHLFFLKGENEADNILEQYMFHEGISLTSTNTTHVQERFSQYVKTNEDLFVVFDSHGSNQYTKQTIKRFRSLAQEKKIRFLIIGRGNENFPCQYDEHDIIIAINGMPRSNLLHAIAMLTGLAPYSFKNDLEHRAIMNIPTTSELKASGWIALVVDDNNTNLDVIRQQLRMLGWAADLAEDGKEALELWRNNTYKIIFTDCHMPVVDGYELAETIRAEEKEGERIPIIAITADAVKGTAERCFASGMDGYLTKPMQLHELHKMIEKWTSTEQDEENTSTNKVTLPPLIDLNVLPELLGSHEPEMLNRIYDKFLETSSKLIKQCRELQLPEDRQKLRDLAHKLKSSAKTVGAHPLAECCQDIEDNIDSEALAIKAKQLYSLLITSQGWLKDYLAKDQ